MESAISSERATENLGPVAQVPLGEGRVFCVGGEAIAIFRGRDGSLFATQATCPHKGGPLADGIIGAEKVVCPLHGFIFSLRTGEALNNSCAQLLTYPVSVNTIGDILLTIDADAQ